MSKFKKILKILFTEEDEQPIEKHHQNNQNTFVEKECTPKTTHPKKEKINYLSVTDVSKHFKIKPTELNIIFEKSNWAKREQKWWVITELGVEQGAKQCYDARNKIKYLRWNEKVKENTILIDAIEEFKKTKKNKPKTNQKKGEEYESFIAEHYKKMGYFVWEHGKEKGRLDQGIDLIVKKDKEIIFVQCKNWKENSKFKIDHVRVKASRAEARQFMLDNPLFKGYKNKFRYTLSSNCMHLSALKYIEETNGLFDYEIIGM